MVEALLGMLIITNLFLVAVEVLLMDHATGKKEKERRLGGVVLFAVAACVCSFFLGGMVSGG